VVIDRAYFLISLRSRNRRTRFFNCPELLAGMISPAAHDRFERRACRCRANRVSTSPRPSSFRSSAPLSNPRKAHSESGCAASAADRRRQPWPARYEVNRMVEECGGATCHLLGRHTLDAPAEHPLLPERIAQPPGPLVTPQAGDSLASRSRMPSAQIAPSERTGSARFGH